MLPTDPKSPWPPVDMNDDYADYQAHSAWYGGDQSALLEAYGGAASSSLGTTNSGGKWRPRWTYFWSRPPSPTNDDGRLKLHVPLAGDISAVSADLLFGEMATFEAAFEGAEAEAAASRMNDLAGEIGLHNALLEAAEVASALGGVYLRPTYDTRVNNELPWLSVIHPDAAVGDFIWGNLVSVTFWRELPALAVGSIEVWRHLEHHEVGSDGRAIVSHRLYRGTAAQVGVPVDLDKHEATEGLEETVDTGIPGLDVRYVANVLPNRRRRSSPLGRSDYQGIEGLMDALDETYTSWMRDIRLGKASLIVPEEYLESRGGKGGRGAGRAFNVDREIYTPLNIPPSTDGKPASIDQVQFEIRTQDHAATALDLVERAVTSAGFSRQTFIASNEGTAESGTALRLRERKTFSTQAKKRRYWERAVEDVAEMLLLIERNQLEGRSGAAVEAVRPRLNWGENRTEPGEAATTISTLRQAQAISIKTAVAMANPDWSQEEIDGEVKEIMDEQGLSVPDPLQAGALP